ncbi:MAG: UDP-N-acetylmuramate--L-alanine ligase [Bacteroidia bacterium]|nr:UDP-N-acetylmuramate--L-alanine ligase [Bacteroidia bacterium]NNJ56058.1 UDP-N-acetylmuramate--L-alanine ligase [Bacteroidia bacterium]
MDKPKYIFFLGVGGIGMSALARYCHQQDYVVYGYDKTATTLTAQLQKEGIPISFEDEVDALPNEIKDNPSETLVVFTPAIPKDNELLNYFKGSNFILQKRAKVLGRITNSTVNLSVAGTHGKTTTSSIVATILQHSNVQFSAFLGGISTNLNSNYYYQEGKTVEHYSVTEADEFDRSFLELKPNYAIITSTDADHLDIYGKKDVLEQSYKEFSKLVTIKENLFSAASNSNLIQGISYSATNTKADYYADVESKNGKGTRFSIQNNIGLESINDLYLNIPGLHNLENAVGATLMTLQAGLPIDSIRKGLANFKGIKRRFEYVLDNKNVTYIDDYAHHPSELNAIISSVKELYPNRKITAIFQPHLYTRTRDFLEGFAEELTKVNELILLPIYPARELPIEGVTSEVLLEKIKMQNAICIDKNVVVKELKERDLDVLLTLGAGDIDQLVEMIKEAYVN